MVKFPEVRIADPNSAFRESGDGRPDIALIPELEHQNSLAAIVIEVKDARGTLPGPEDLATAEGGLDLLAKRALAQVRGRHYGADLSGRGLLLWGVAFRGKASALAARAVRGEQVADRKSVV